jgi:Ca2+/H+ antiporter, TMEM165/GDT1 family
MNAFLISTLTIAAAEIGDKTQFLAIALSTRYQRPAVIILGILIATLANHLVAALLGVWLSKHIHAQSMHLILAVSYFIAAIWICIPDSPPTEKQMAIKNTYLLLTVILTFFLAEIGDKTQIATAILAANYHHLIPVVLGTTTGMMLANVPAVFVGQKIASYIPMKVMHGIAAGIFFLLGLKELLLL